MPNDADDQRREDQRAGNSRCPTYCSSIQAAKAPIMNNAPWAKLMMFSMPKITARPKRQHRVERAVDQAEQELAEQRLRRYAQERLDHRRPPIPFPRRWLFAYGPPWPPPGFIPAQAGTQ